jgi:hypothetical protein
MDTVAQQRQIVKQVIEYYANFQPSHGNIRLDTVFDEAQGRYALMQIGWDRTKRINGNLIYITLRDSKIWIEYDGMEQGITDDLISSGIPEEQIVHAWLPEIELTPSL